MPHRESEIRTGVPIGDPNRRSETDSHERTNERTNGETTYVELSGNSPERARVYAEDGFVTVGSVILAGEFGQTDKRHPNIRSGPRTEIPRHVRAGVWFRDGGRCAHHPCETPEDDKPLHLDHIKPWSAGGPDTSDNLRVLCEFHNLERSNFIDFAQPKRPVTWWCHRCHDVAYHFRSDGTMQCPIHHAEWVGYVGGPANGGTCRVARAFIRASNGDGDFAWFHRPVPEDYTVIAYCAHCDAPGLTGAVL